MGALHDGHLSLLRRARSECDVVVATLFVNPAQFNDTGDLAAYPRDEQRDLVLAAQEGVDFVFAPDGAEIYPVGFTTTVSVAGLTESLEGAHRGRGHFDGVTTVVATINRSSRRMDRLVMSSFRPSSGCANLSFH